MQKRSTKLVLFAAPAFVAATIRAPSPGLTQPLPPAICHPAPAEYPVPTTLAGWAASAQVFDGLGRFHRAATGATPEAQLYFDQGFRLLWAFNHDEATRSFARAAQLAPGCAICFWGVALAIGPNYNDTAMSENRGKVAYAALQRAITLAPTGAPAEQALIAALSQRFPTPAAITRASFPDRQAAYTTAMLAAATAYPADDDIQTLGAETLMDQHAWKLWSLDGRPAPGTLQVIALLDRVLSRNPQHPGANHYLIHALEASPDPARAEQAANRLGALMPAAGHLVHMPSHIYQRIGRYADAAAANDRAARADLAYFARNTPQFGYAGYTAHNWRFEAFAAAEIGRRDEALAASRHADALYPEVDLVKNGESGWHDAQRYFLHVRFGDWPWLLAAAPPDPRLTGLTDAFLWAQGTALAATGHVQQAQSRRAELAKREGDTKATEYAGFNALRSMLHIALLTLDARIASASNDQPRRLASLSQAVQAEDALSYDEPADWLQPVRPLFGRALLENHDPVGAERVYREDLRRRPGNGWSLQGLSLALAAQGKTAEAASTGRDFDKVWLGSDTKLAASAF